MELLCKMQNYEWGKMGCASKVACFYKNTDEQFVVDKNLPYAELWMGTHINGPSVIKKTGEPLSLYISQHPECLGQDVLKVFDKNLPFLFKILSINKPLSIQVHPTKKHAEELHNKFPDIYKDPNHKPEIAIAVTPFEALCGFRPVKEIREFIRDLPELSELLNEEICSCNDDKFLRESFWSILNCDKAKMSEIITALVTRFKDMVDVDRNKLLADLVERLNHYFPNDNGVLMVYFLNYMKLEPGQAIFLAANVPHAYLFGDCIENMACSDNVVRAGLTPKFVDVETLCRMLTYESGKATDLIFTPIREDDFTRLFKPPVQDFAVAEIKVPVSKASYNPIKRHGASIFLVVEGTAKYNNGKLIPGTVLFLPAEDILELSDITEDLLIYQALANV